MNNLECYGRFARLALILTCFSVMAGCSLFRPVTDSQAWPDDVPDREYFESVYESDPENQAFQDKEAYLSWIIRFYQGSAVYRQGWNDQVPDIINSVDENERQALEQKLHRLGKRISANWAKDNSVRHITTAHLATWGQAMNESVVEGDQTELIQQIARDVERLLQGKLKPQAIVENRYYEEDKNDVFR